VLKKEFLELSHNLLLVDKNKNKGRRK